MWLGKLCLLSSRKEKKIHRKEEMLTHAHVTAVTFDILIRKLERMFAAFPA